MFITITFNSMNMVSDSLAGAYLNSINTYPKTWQILKAKDKIYYVKGSSYIFQSYERIQLG